MDSRKIENISVNSICVTEILTKRDKEIFLSIYRLLTMVITLSIKKRSRSASTKITELARLNIHRDINVKIIEVVDIFSCTERKKGFFIKMFGMNG